MLARSRPERSASFQPAESPTQGDTTFNRNHQTTSPFLLRHRIKLGKKPWPSKPIRAPARFTNLAGRADSLTSPRHSRDCNVLSAHALFVVTYQNIMGQAHGVTQRPHAPRCYLWTAPPLMCRGQIRPRKTRAIGGRDQPDAETRHRSASTEARPSATQLLSPLEHRSTRTSRLRCRGSSIGTSRGRQKAVSWLARVRLFQLARYGSNVRNFSLNWCMATSPGRSAFLSPCCHFLSLAARDRI